MAASKDDASPSNVAQSDGGIDYTKYGKKVSEGGYLKDDNSGYVDQAAIAADRSSSSSSSSAPPINLGIISSVAPDVAQNAQQPPDNSAQGQATQAVQAANWNNVIATEFGESDRPSRGGYTEANWNIGKWGDTLEGEDNQGVALPYNVLKNYGNYNHPEFAKNFNQQFDVVITDPKTGAQTVAPLKDVGPGQSTGAGLDLLWGTRAALGLGGRYKGALSYAIVPKGSMGSFAGGSAGSSSGAPGESPEAPWDIAASQMMANPAAVTFGALFQQQVQKEAGTPTIQVGTAPLSSGDPNPVNVAGSSIQAPTISKAGDLRAQTKPESFGLRVATPEDVASYDQYLKNGGSPDVIDPYDKLAIALAKNPTFLTDPNNVNVLKEMVYNPMQAQQKGLSTNQKVAAAVNQAGAGLGEIASDVGAYVRTAWQDAVPVVRYLFSKATGQVPDQDAVHGMADLNAVNAQGSAKLVSDLYNMVGGLSLGSRRIGTNIMETATSDPAKKADLEQQYMLAQQGHVRNLQALYNLGQEVQANTAKFYTWTGAFSDLGNQLAKTQPDPKAIEGLSQIIQIAAPVADAISAAKGASLVFRPLMLDSALEGGEDLAAATSRKFAFDATQAVPPNVGEEAANSAYNAARSAQSGLAPDARAANQAYAQGQQDLMTKLTGINKMTGDPGAVSHFQANLANMAADSADRVGQIASNISSVGDRILNATSLGNPTFRSIQEKILRGMMFGMGAHGGHAFFGRAMEVGLDVAEELPHLQGAMAPLTDLLRTYGREKLYGESSIPFWTRVSEGTKLISPRMASFLDSPAVLSFQAMATHGATGLLGGAALGALADPDDPLGGAAQGAAMGGILGMAGGGFSQWLRYKTPNAHYAALRGDWKRTGDMMSAAEKSNFLKLPSQDQLMIGTYMQQHPGLRMNFVHDPAGPAGMHYFDVADRPTIQLNTAHADSPIRALFAHELMHQAQTAGMLPDVYDTLLGNPQRGTLGQYTARDLDGNPLGVDPTTGRYIANQEFQNYKNQYVTDLARSGQPHSQVSDLNIAKEIYAEHGVDYLLSGKGYVDGASAYRPGWMNSEGMKRALANTGFSFDDNGGFVRGSGLFDNLQRNSALDNLTSNYLRTRFHDRKMDAGEDMSTRVFRQEDLRGNAPDTFLDSAPEIRRNPDGTVMRDKNTGLPIMRTPSEVKEYNAKLAQDIFDRVDALPEDRKADIGHQITTNGAQFFRYLPQDIRDALAQSNQYNPHQIRGLNVLSEMLADKAKMGTNFNVFYHKALSAKKKYGQFEGTEKFVVPYGIEVTKDGNVNIKSVEFAQLTNNYLRNAKRFKDLWTTPGDFSLDSNTYFQNHAAGNPGADGIGVAKKNAINLLLGLETQLHRESNPLLGETKSPRARSIIKSLRIDRASRITPTEQISPFTTVEQYNRMNMNYRPRRFQPGDADYVAAPSDEAYKAARKKKPVERSNDENEVMAAKTISDWNGQRDTVPLRVQRDANGKIVTDDEGRIQYQGQSYQLQQAPVIQRIFNRFGRNEKGMDKASDLLSNRIVKQYRDWESDPELHGAIGWYSGMRDRLQAAFGANIDKFGNLLAATSPQTDVATNFDYTLQALRKFSKGDYDELMQRFQKHAMEVTDRVWADDSIRNKEAAIRKEINTFKDIPLKENGKKFGFNGQRVLHALTDYWVDQAGGPKTANFGKNLTWRSTDPTIDLWAGRTARRLLYEGEVPRWRTSALQEQGVGSKTVSGTDDYTLAEDSFRKAANKLGIKPDDLQAFMWFGEKKNYASQGWAKGKGAELGDFRRLQDEMGTERYQVGLTTDKGVNKPGDLEGARRSIERDVQGLKGVVNSRATLSEGHYGGSREPSLDVEWTGMHGMDVSPVEARIKQIAKENDQDSAFISRIHDDKDHPNARPMVEMGFDRPATEDELSAMKDLFEKHELGGFTVARDSRGQALGIRSQAVPEFIDSVPKERYFKHWTKKLDALRNDSSFDRSNITYDKQRYADTKVFQRGKHY
jgi:hypothetical protein